MTRSPSQHSLARRALVLPPTNRRRSWVTSGVAVLGVSVMGLAAAGPGDGWQDRSEAVGAHEQVVTSVSAGLVAAPLAGTTAVPTVERVSRSGVRPALASDAVQQETKQVKAANLKASKRRAAQQKEAKRRAAQQKEATRRAAQQKEATRRAAEQKEARQKAAQQKEASQKATRRRAAMVEAAATDHRQSSHASLPVTSGYHIAARFGDTGSWARYHTGIDFAAPVGTTIHAADSGTVTHAGYGSQGWAGHYVTIRHADGKSTLYAHMSAVSVDVGQHVEGGKRIGAIGMTGRTFGPHVHFELYPAGVTPRDPYDAINPAPWLRARGLHI